MSASGGKADMDQPLIQGYGQKLTPAKHVTLLFGVRIRETWLDPSWTGEGNSLRSPGRL